MEDGSETTRDDGARDAKGRFQPGRSGNPAGRQRGSRNRATLLRERLNPAQEAAVINKAFDNLLTAIGDGRLGASIVLLDALAPKPRGRAIDLELPDDALPEDILDKAMWDMARGIITLDEALGIARYVKERQALQQQEYVSRRARARIARREAEEAALAAAEAAAAEAAVTGTAAAGQDAAGQATTRSAAAVDAGGAGEPGPMTAPAAAPPPTLESVTAEAIRVVAAARALAAAEGRPGPMPGSILQMPCRFRSRRSWRRCSGAGAHARAAADRPGPGCPRRPDGRDPRATRWSG